MATNPNNTVYIDININIQNVTHFQQYEYMGKIIYIMGETHNIVSVECPNPITVAQYISIALLTNDKADVIAEQTSFGKLEGLISSNIISTYETIKSSALIPEERYKYGEYRPYFLQVGLTYLFYAPNDRIGKKSIRNIINYFIEPFFNKQKLFNYETKVFSNLQEKVKKGIKEVKQQIYDDFVSIKRQLELREIFEQNFENTKDIINDVNTIERIKRENFQKKLDFINRIRFLWVRVNDSFILPDLFDTTQSETFLLIGSHHSKNLMNIFLFFNQQMNIPINMLQYNENPNGCINVSKPISLYGENIRSKLREIEAIENKVEYTDDENEIIRLLRTIEL